MKTALFLLAASSVLLFDAALADTVPATAAKPPTVTAKPAKPVKARELSCQDFLSYDEVTRPQIVYWSQGLARKGKPEDAVIDIAQVNQLVPVIVEDCTREPQSSFWQRMKADIRKVL